MRLKEIETELLLKALKEDINCIYTHVGFINYSYTNGERQLLHDLAIKLNDKASAILIGEYVFTPYFSSYNGGTELAGIRISNVIK